MARTGVRFGRLSVLVAVALSVSWMALRGPAVQATDASEPIAAPVEAAGEEHIVRPGDTLWGIAGERVGPGGDPRPLIEQIRQVNGLSSGALSEGAVLVIP